MSGELSPTLTLRVRAPEALSNLKAMTLAANELKGALAGLGGSAGAGTAELKQALRAQELELQQHAEKKERIKRTSEERAAAAAEKAAARALVQEQKANQRLLAEQEKAAVAAEKMAQASSARRMLIQANTAKKLWADHDKGTLVVDQSLQKQIDAQEAARMRAANAELLRQKKLHAELMLGVQREAESRRAISQARDYELAQTRARANAAMEASIKQQADAQDLARQKAANAEKLRQKKLHDELMLAAQREASARRAAMEARDYDLWLLRGQAASARQAMIEKRDMEMYLQRGAAQRAAAGGAGGDGGVGRSAVRGAAYGAGGGMFLSYGASIPALASAYVVATQVKGAISDGAKFQKEMAFVKIASEDAAESITHLSEKLLALGGKTPFAPTELATGLRILTEAGFETKDAFNALLPVMKLAALGELNVGQSAGIAQQMVHAFGLEIRDVERVTDVLVKVANVSATNVKQMAEAMRPASAVAKQYNIDLETMTALLGVLAKVGITGSSAGTALMNMLRGLYSTNTTHGLRALKDLGGADGPLKTLDAAGNMRNIVEVVQDLARASDRLDSGTFQRLIQDLTNIRGVRGVVNEVSDAFKDLPRFLDEARKSGGYVDRSFKDLGTTLEQTWKTFKGAVEATQIKAFRESSDDLTEALRKFTEFASSSQFETAIKALVNGFGKILGVVADVTTGVTKITASAATAPGRPLVGAATPMGFMAELTRRLVMRDQEAGSARSTSALHNSAGKITGLLPLMPLPTEVKSVKPPGEPKPMRDTDLEVLKGAQAAEASREFNRRVREIEQTSRFALAAVDQLHHYKLITDERYNEEVEAINKARVERELEMEMETVKRLQDAAAALYRHDQGPKYKLAVTQVNEAKDKVAQLTRQAEHDTAMRQGKLEGEAHLRRIKNAEELQEVRERGFKSLSKLTVEGELGREGLQVGHNQALMPEVVAAGYAAELATRRKFKDEVGRINDEIREKDGQRAQYILDMDDKRAQQAAAVIDLLKEHKAAVEALQAAEVERNVRQATSLAEEQRSLAYGAKEAFQKYQDAATNAAEHARAIFSSVTKGMEDALVNFSKTGKLSFREFADSVIDAMIRIQAQKAAAGLTNMLGGAIPGLGGIFGMSGSTTASAAASAGAGDLLQVVAKMAHTGGIIGQLNDSRSVDPSVFANAPRFHTGGIVGHEQPIIAMKGEGVFTPEQMSRLAPAGAGNVFQIEVNVDVQSGGAQVSGNGSAGLAQFGERVGVVVREEIMKQKRPGGLLAEV